MLETQTLCKINAKIVTIWKQFVETYFFSKINNYNILN